MRYSRGIARGRRRLTSADAYSAFVPQCGHVTASALGFGWPGRGAWAKGISFWQPAQTTTRYQRPDRTSLTMTPQPILAEG